MHYVHKNDRRNTLIVQGLFLLAVIFLTIAVKQGMDKYQLSLGKFPAAVDLEKDYVLVELTSTNDISKFKGYHRVIQGNFADYKWPAGTLPFYAGNGGFFDVAKGEFLTNTPPSFILPLYLDVLKDDVAKAE